jgi:signal transduction histidine kinase
MSEDSTTALPNSSLMTHHNVPQPLQVLLVDDNSTNLKVLLEAIQGQGWTLLVATDGETAIEQAEYAQPDLILLDVRMPGISGFETCQRLKAEPLTCDIPVIFMTALSDSESKAKGFELGAVDYITKPFQEAEVLARVKTHLQLRCLTKKLEQEVAERTAELEQATLKLKEYSQTLEQKVEERTQSLSQALETLQTAQQELIQSEKMAALGQLTASVAHEINTPLGVIRGATSNIIAALSTSVLHLPDLLQSLSAQQQTEFLALIKTAIQHPQPLSTQEERQLRRQLQNDLAAQGIADVNQVATQLTLLRFGFNLNSYQSILHAPNCHHILEVAYNLVLQSQNATSILQEVDRAAKIVFALKTYSHHSEPNEQSEVPIIDSIEVALTLYYNRIKQGIKVVRQYEEVPPIVCNPDELTQVWVNLIDNALYAMGQSGQLVIHVYQQGLQVVVTITDSGEGIPADLQARIFEPFFTTKPRGEGSGLGLDIVRQIVRSHIGEIQVQSQPGQTTFTVRFPVPGIAAK